MQKFALAALVAVASTPIAAETLAHASFYGKELAGRKTASGERFNPAAMTAAHRTLPFGTKLLLTYPKTGNSVVVRVNDRGPFVRGRTLDVSLGAARVLGFAGNGTATLRMERTGLGKALPTTLLEPAKILDQAAEPVITPEEEVLSDNHVDRAIQNR